MLSDQMAVACCFSQLFYFNFTPFSDSRNVESLNYLSRTLFLFSSSPGNNWTQIGFGYEGLHRGCVKTQFGLLADSRSSVQHAAFLVIKLAPACPIDSSSAAQWASSGCFQVASLLDFCQIWIIWIIFQKLNLLNMKLYIISLIRFRTKYVHCVARSPIAEPVCHRLCF